MSLLSVQFFASCYLASHHTSETLTSCAQSIMGLTGPAFERLDRCGADPSLIDLAKRCLAKEPADRPQDAAAIAERRASVADNLKRAEQERAEVAVRTAEQRKRRNVWIGLVAAMLLGTITSALFALQANSARRDAELAQDAATKSAEREADERRKAEQEKKTADAERSKAIASAEGEVEQRKLAEKQQQKAERLLYGSQISQARHLLETNEFRSARDILRNCKPEYRSWEHDYLSFELIRGQVLLHEDAEILCFAVHPKLDRVAIAKRTGEISIRDLSNGNTLEVIPIIRDKKNEIISIAYSPEGDQLAIGTDKSIIPDGTTLITRSSKRGLTIWNAQTYEIIEDLAGEISKGQMNNPSDNRDSGPWVARRFFTISPDSKKIAIPERGGILIWDIANSREISTIKNVAGVNDEFAFSPDSRRFAAAGSERSILIWDLESGNPVLQLPMTDGANYIRFSPDGKQLLAGSGASSKMPEVRLWQADCPGDDQPNGRDVHQREALRRLKEWSTPQKQWHEKRLYDEQGVENWFAVIFHLKRLIAIDPNNAEYQKRLKNAEKAMADERETLPDPPVGTRWVYQDGFFEYQGDKKWIDEKKQTFEQEVYCKQYLKLKSSDWTWGRARLSSTTMSQCGYYYFDYKHVRDGKWQDPPKVNSP
jgi:hypothetical protein